MRFGLPVGVVIDVGSINKLRPVRITPWSMVDTQRRKDVFGNLSEWSKALMVDLDWINEVLNLCLREKVAQGDQKGKRRNGFRGLFRKIWW